VVSYAPIVGVRVLAHPRLRLGLTYRGESRSRYDIQIKSDLGNAIPLSIPVLHVSGTAQFDPHQLQLEGAADATRWLRLLLGATWKHWSSFSNPVENATAGAPPQAPPGYHDTVVPRLGAEASHRAGPLVLVYRLGYFFEWSPAPDGPTRVLLDADRHALTGGLGLAYPGRVFSFQLDAFAQWHHLSGSARATGDLAVFGAALGVDL
jgi:long-chain fatty acid transport protein